MNTPEIFISYSWHDPQSVALTNALDQFLQTEGIMILRDNRNIPYKGGIKEYMERLGRGKYVILVLCEAYFTSPNCMFELLQLAEHEDFKDRIFPVTVAGVKMYDPEDLIRYRKYWKDKKEHLQQLMKEDDLDHQDGIREKLDLYEEIRQNISRLVNFVGNLNTFPLQGNNFEPLWKAIQTQIVKDSQPAVRLNKKTEKKMLQDQPLPIDPISLRNAYLSRLLTTFSQVSFVRIEQKAVASETEACLNLRAIYTALLTSSSDQEEAMLAAQRSVPRKRDEEGKTRQLSALDQLNRRQRLVLLGEPGSGKSTFVKFVAICLAGELLEDPCANLTLLMAPLPNDDGEDQEEPQVWQHGALLPVPVILRDFAAKGLPPPEQLATAKHLWAFITKTLEETMLGEYAPVLRQHLRQEGGLLLLDGLDEVPEADQRRAQIKRVVEDFVVAFPRCRVLVTSRTYAYQKQDWRLQGFAETVLASFTTGQIRRFVNHWYRYTSDVRGTNLEDAQGRAELLTHAILTNPRLYELAERPLLLTLMADLHDHWGKLPDRREKLYHETVELLLAQWESQKIVRDERGQVIILQPSLRELLKLGQEGIDGLRGLLNMLAYEAHAAQATLVGTADVPEDRLAGELLRLNQSHEVNLTRLIEYLRDRAGLLLPRGVGVYTFPHRTFQEYLAACYMTDEHDYPNNIADLARREPNRWREVALLAGAKVARGSAAMIWQLVQALCAWHPTDPHVTLEDVWGALLAGQVLVETADLKRIHRSNQPQFDRVRDWLAVILTARQASKMPALPAVERALAGNLLAQLGDPREGVGLQNGLPDIVWCEVPAGKFTMGSNDYDDEKPPHEVHLKTYWISRYPVTNVQYRAFVDDNGYTEQWRECWTDEGWKWKEENSVTQPDWAGGVFDLPNHPVVGVSWYEATAFCNWLTRKTSPPTPLQRRGEKTSPLRGRGGGGVIRLPTEAEWEKAARGEDQRIYPWGNEQVNPERANYGDTGLGATSAVGCFPDGASPYQCEDMAGNVWEWCVDDWPGNYKGAPTDGSAWRGGGSGRVIRGGGWDNIAPFVRCAYRDSTTPDDRDTDLGFRLARIYL
jgi:formylglycine-generating enzyme required for sulfatase activity